MLPTFPGVSLLQLEKLRLDCTESLQCTDSTVADFCHILAAMFANVQELYIEGAGYQVDFVPHHSLFRNLRKHAFMLETA